MNINEVVISRLKEIFPDHDALDLAIQNNNTQYINTCIDTGLRYGYYIPNIDGSIRYSMAPDPVVANGRDMSRRQFPTVDMVEIPEFTDQDPNAEQFKIYLYTKLVTLSCCLDEIRSEQSNIQVEN